MMKTLSRLQDQRPITILIFWFNKFYNILYLKANQETNESKGQEDDVGILMMNFVPL
jgi:hypothetical protein